MFPSPLNRQNLSHRGHRSVWGVSRWLVLMAVGGLALVAVFLVPTRSALAQPGLESFAKQPETPLELWDAIDYLVRVGKADEAAPLLDRFLQSNPDDLTLLEIRDRFGIGSVLRLEDHPETAGRAEDLLNRIDRASERYARDADRIRRSVDLLTASPPEQEVGVRRLRDAGPHVVPYLIEAIRQAGPETPERSLIVGNMGRLGSRVVPPLIAALDAREPSMAADAASALGRIGDRRALPFLVAAAIDPGNERAPVREAARAAIRRLTGASLDDLPRSPIQILLDEARKYMTGAYQFSADQVTVWSWRGETVEPQIVRPQEAEAMLGRRFVDHVLKIKPEHPEAKALRTVFRVQEAVQRLGPDASLPPGGVISVPDEVTSADSDELSDALAIALEARLWDDAAVLTTALGRAIGPEALRGEQPSLLVQALEAPDRFVQFAAARAIVKLNPERPFPGSSRVVPILERFLHAEPSPHAVIIDGAIHRGNAVAGMLDALGYETTVAADPRNGFLQAAGSAGVELLLISPTALQGPWGLPELLTNLRADPRTSALPILLYGESELVGRRLSFVDERDDRVEYLILPPAPDALSRQLDRMANRLNIRPMTADERLRHADEAASLLAEIAERPVAAFRGDLPQVADSLRLALGDPTLAPSAAQALAAVPTTDAQRDLADVALDVSRPSTLRRTAANQLARSIRRFGLLLAADQRSRLRRAVERADDPELKASLETVLDLIGVEPGATAR